MAGPTAGVLLENPLTEDQLAYIRSAIAEVSSHSEGDDFWLRERPFILGLGHEYEGELEEYIEDGLQDIMGWIPRAVVGVAAMCNQPIDHRLLGELCLRFASLLHGTIDFGGELRPETEHFGTLWEVPYRAASGQQCRYHVGDKEFLAWWLRQPEFSMVK